MDLDKRAARLRRRWVPEALANRRETPGRSSFLGRSVRHAPPMVVGYPHWSDRRRGRPVSFRRETDAAAAWSDLTIEEQTMRRRQPLCKRRREWSVTWSVSGLLGGGRALTNGSSPRKRLRPYFLHDRRLLGVLSRTAYDTLRDFLRASLGDQTAVPGVIASVQTFGSLLNWQPHLHFLVTDGAYREDGTFLPLSFHDPSALTEAFRRAILAEFVKLELFTPEIADSMLAWPHSGFHVHHHVRIDSGDAAGRAHVARYAVRAPVALSRMTYDAKEAVVRIVSDKLDGPTAGTHTFDALEFLANLLVHVPRHGEVCVRYYGAYSVRRRSAWRKSGVRAGREADPDGDDQPREDVPERVRARRRRWAELLRRIWDVDIETCPRCGGNMAILAFTMDPAAIDAALRGLRDQGREPRAGPWSARAPPADAA